MPQANDNKRFGMAFPLQTESAGGGLTNLARCSYEEHIRQSIRTLLLTARGERVMRPDFGSALGDFLFENIDATTVALIKREVVSTIERYEPRVNLTDVKVHSDARDPGVLRVTVEYRIISTGAADSLVVDASATR